MRALVVSVLVLAGSVAAARSAPAQDVDWTKAEEVDVTLSDFKFSPSELHLHHGAAYRLHLVNAGSGGHNFEAEDLFAASSLDPEDAGKVRNGRVEVAKGGSQDVRFVPGAAGSYRLRCTHFLHAAMGMTGLAVVD